MHTGVPPIIQAVGLESEKLVKALIDGGANCSVVYAYDHDTDNERTPREFALSNNLDVIVEMLKKCEDTRPMS